MIRAPIGSLPKAAVSLAALIPLLSACIALTALPRAVITDADRNVTVRSVPCSAGGTVLALAADSRQALDPHAIRPDGGVAWRGYGAARGAAKGELRQ